ncbi:MAG: LPS export ABC transporter periplasmic protein LptC [Bacteroidetes bacterium]|nr:LPS export ABC transporter periplasmic protein LptC [Bacteroidota bacterium]
MDADYGIRYERDQRMEARKNVVVVNQKAIGLIRNISFGMKKQKLISDEFVKITTKDQIIYGDGFEANEDFTKYKIFKTRGTIPINTSTHVKDS